uniref:Uncharacterized protein n=1 Tax=Oryza barthii TaxID=65489 RepID=A0A0D3GDR8_9ORYZ
MHETETPRLQHACTHDVDIVRPSIRTGGGRGGEEASAAVPSAQLLRLRGSTTARRRLVGCTQRKARVNPSQGSARGKAKGAGKNEERMDRRLHSHQKRKRDGGRERSR